MVFKFKISEDTGSCDLNSLITITQDGYENWRNCEIPILIVEQDEIRLGSVCVVHIQFLNLMLGNGNYDRDAMKVVKEIFGENVHPYTLSSNLMRAVENLSQLQKVKDMADVNLPVFLSDTTINHPADVQLEKSKGIKEQNEITGRIVWLGDGSIFFLNEDSEILWGIKTEQEKSYKKFQIYDIQSRYLVERTDQIIGNVKIQYPGFFETKLGDERGDEIDLIVFSNDYSKMAFTLGRNKRYVFIGDTKNLNEISSIRIDDDPTGSIFGMKISPDLQHLVVFTSEILIFDLNTNSRCLKLTTDHYDFAGFSGINIDNNQKYLSYGNHFEGMEYGESYNEIVLLDYGRLMDLIRLESNRLIKVSGIVVTRITRPGNYYEGVNIEFSNDSKMMAINNSDFILYDIEERQITLETSLSGEIQFHPNEKYLSLNSSNYLHLVNVKEGIGIARINFEKIDQEINFTPEEGINFKIINYNLLIENIEADFLQYQIKELEYQNIDPLDFDIQKEILDSIIALGETIIINENYRKLHSEFEKQKENALRQQVMEKELEEKLKMEELKKEREIRDAESELSKLINMYNKIENSDINVKLLITNEILKLSPIIQIDKNWEKTKIRLEAEINALDISDQKIEDMSKLLKLIHQLTSDIPVNLSRLAELLKLEETNIAMMLKNLIENHPLIGQYLELEQVFIKRDEMENGTLGVILDDFVDPEIPHIDCPNCSISVSVRIRECPACEVSIPFCQICKQSFLPQDKLSSCDNCSNQFHFKHLYAYVQSMGTCPLCKSELRLGNVK